ncbi:hypothetical protein Mgra_00009400 [Meloidogyne graminicola]|uniref:Uncharacterized protein n=1 Tax=Meloidogyne graminicola TaxID=189291 RepID=A0A8S9ZC67_9BILA|nr:hypothetical protein Mgra_00009400 [Meloidogyne graminicola]
MTIEKGVLVFKASNGDTGLLWLPKLSRQKHCQTGLALYQLGQWLLYDSSSDRVLPLEGAPPYKTRIFNDNPRRDALVEINVPICFFGDRTFNEFVAYAPGFGRVGVLRKQPNLKMDCLFHAWIAFFGLYRDANLARFINMMNVQWLLTSLGEPFTIVEMQSAAELGLIEKLVNGIVISYSDSDSSSDSDSGNDRSENDDEEQDAHRQLRSVTFWTPWLYSICTFCHEESNEVADLNSGLVFRVGTWFSFMPAKNWSNQGVAISPFRIKTPKGMALIGRDPLKRRTPFYSEINISLRIAHNLYTLDQDPTARFCTFQDGLVLLNVVKGFLFFYDVKDKNMNWVPLEFDGRGSPIREASAQEVTDDSWLVDEEGVEVKESDAGDLESERSPSLSTSDGFGLYRCSAKMNIFSSETTIKGVNDSDDPLHVTHNQQENVRDDGSRPQFSARTGRRSSPISSQQDETFLQNCNHRPGGIEKKNLSGVVVEKLKNNNRNKTLLSIYSPEFGELSVSASMCGNLPIGSWVKRVNDREIKPSEFEVEQVAPFETVTVGNTIKIKMNVYIPRRWYPRMSTFEPIVKTDFIATVIDSKGLFDETCAGQQLTVWIARSVCALRKKMGWHVDRIDD